MFRPPTQGNLVNDSKAKVSLQGKRHDKTGESGTKDERRTPHLKDDNRSTAPARTSQAGNPSKDSTLRRDRRTKMPNPSPTPTLLKSALWSPPLPQPKNASGEKIPPL